MKLYTEKQVIKAIDLSRLQGAEPYLVKYREEEILNMITPIVIPSDDKIIYKCFQKDSYELATDGDSALKIYSDGYKAALEQILNQNK